VKIGISMFWVLGAALLMVCDPSLAHHGTAAYDENSPVTLDGTVTEFLWMNPHSQILFDVQDDKGNVVHWTCETLNPGKMVRAGWTKNTLKPGDKVSITLSPAKDGTSIGLLKKVVLADGRVLGVR
jgi:hypothetical protein